MTSTLSRLYGRTLRDIIEEENKEKEAEEQSGFRAGKSCIDNIFCLKLFIEKKITTGRELHLLFIDLSKAYDNIPIEKLWEAIEQTNIYHTIIKALKNLYQGSAIQLTNPTVFLVVIYTIVTKLTRA